MEMITPVIGNRYWWYSHSRMVLTITVVDVESDVPFDEPNFGSVKLHWQLYKGLVSNTTITEGDVVWTGEEWNSASLMPHKNPLTEKDLEPDEQLCRSCNGTYFEVERDFDILPCIWCKTTGKTQKSLPPSKPVRRSMVHPEVKK